MVDALKLSNQAPRASGESVQTCVTWRCTDGIQHLFCWPILAVSDQSLASNGPIVDSRYLNLVFGPTEATYNKLFPSSPTKYKVEPSLIRSNLFEELDDYEFQRRFRLTKQSVAELTLLIEEKLESKTPCNNALKPVEQVLIALRFYAVACMQLAIADLFDVSQPTVCRVAHRVSEAIASLLPDFIHLPVNREECKTVSRKFFSIAGFPKIIGALDGTFVRIVSPGGEDAERFRCRKNYFALNVQTIVDSDLVIRNVVARWPGSAHDSTVFNNSAACLSLKTNALYQDFHLLGDTGYPCEKNIY
ncbi:putative nuclease HARBI1 [Trichonephila clavipes]|nr:putative nuclease HARBI1 [Trichonephila clavipes]